MCNLVMIVFTIALAVHSVVCDFDLLIVHNNDMHARFEETERNSGTCKEQNKNKTCIGGFARTAHEIRRFRRLAQEGKGPEVLFLNAGDTYVGTTWYSLYTTNITTEFVNILEPDVICLGNHEFDAGVARLVPFVENVRCPIVAANLDFANEPTITKVVKSVVLERSGRKIGIIGHLTQETLKISTPGKTIFYDEVESVKVESERLQELGVDIILVLGHSGYLLDQKIAEQVPLVDAVIGGHTNTFLWNGNKPDSEIPEDLYPKVITQPSGKEVPVVQAYAYTKYLGVLNLTFDDRGNLTKFVGQPIYLDSSIPQDEDVLELLEKYRPGIIAINAKVIGQSKVILDGDANICRAKECNFGNLVADAYVMYRKSVSALDLTPIGLQNGGGIRNTIEPRENGDITYGEMLGAIPFGNQIITLKLNGSDLIKTLEIGARSNGETSKGEFLQVSGLKVEYDMSMPAYSRVVSVQVRCQTCNEELYEDLNLDKNYTIVTSSFLATEGGDDHYILAQHSFDKIVEDLMDVDVLEWYFNNFSPVEPKVEGRIVIKGQTDGPNSGNLNKANTLMFGLLFISIIFNKYVI